MQQSILSFVNALKADKRVSQFDEAKTKQAIVLPMLSNLGWSVFDVGEVIPEYSVGASRVDYCLSVGSRSRVFIEVKRTPEEIENHQEQLLAYSFKEGVKLAVLTNGLTWWFYLPLREGDWEERKFYSIDIIEQDAAAIAGKFVDFLSRELVANGKAHENAERARISRGKSKTIRETLPKAWNKLLTDTDDLLVDLMADRTEVLCGFKPDTETVTKFLAHHAAALLIPSDTAKPKPPKVIKTKVKRISKRKGNLTKKARKPSPQSVRGKKVRAFVFKGREYPVETWKAVLMDLCGLIYKARKKSFHKVLELEGTKHKYFSLDPREFANPWRIADSDVYTRVGLSARGVVRRCYQVLDCFGYDPGDFELVLK